MVLPISSAGPISPVGAEERLEAWQDRWMPFGFAARPQTASSRHFAPGFRPIAQTMKDDRNVRYPSG
jgi:hypothetical protein